jgi:hypothetical protein
MTTHLPIQKPSQNRKNDFNRLAIEEPIFSVANADFGGGFDEHGFGACVCLVIYGQPSHNFYRPTIQEHTFLCLIQNLKAVAMGMVTAIELFWSTSHITGAEL